MRCMVTTSFAAAALLAIAAAVLSAAPASAALPSRVKFGQYAPMTGPVSYMGRETRDGILAAFREVNAAGGLQGTTQLDIVTADDGYVSSNTPVVLQQMYDANPDIVALLSGVGSPTTTASIPFIEANAMANVGTVTGSSAFRVPFRPELVNIRSGYDNEAFTMLNLVMNVLKKRRIALFFQNDSFGGPATRTVVEALPLYGVEAVAVIPYLSSMDMTQFDFAGVTQQLVDADAEVVLIWATGPWTMRLLQELLPRSPNVVAVTVSFVGSGLLRPLREAGLNPTNVYVTQVYPSPRDMSSALVRRYRDAMIALNGTSATFSYLALEGYVAGRFAIEVLNRTVRGTKAEFLDTVYRSRMFGLDEFVAGPYERDCVIATRDASFGRSALCECSQGLRFIRVTRVTANYDFEEYTQGDQQFSLAQCFPTPATSVSAVAVAGLLAPSATVPSLASQRAEHGLALVPNGVAARVMPYPDGSFADVAATATGHFNVTALFLPIVSGREALDNRTAQTRQTLLVDPVMVPQVPWGSAFDESIIAPTATLERQIFAAAEHMRARVPGVTLRVLVGSHVRAETASEIAVIMEDTRRTVGVPGAPGRLGLEFTLPQLAAAYATASGAIFVVGVTTETEMRAVLALLALNPNLRIFVAFDELCVTYAAVLRCVQIGSCDASTLDRLHYSTNVAPWLDSDEATADELSVQYHSSSAATDGMANRHPMEARGLMIGLMTAYVKERTARITPAELRTALYGSSMISVPGRRIGPFVNVPCAGVVECRCNSGATTVTTRSLWPLAQLIPASAGSTALRSGPVPDEARPTTTAFSTCQIVYTPEVVEKESHLAVIIAVPLVALAIAATVGLILRHVNRPNRYAPVEDGRPIAVAYLALRGFADLLEADPRRVRMLKQFGEHVRRSARKHRCHVAHKVGDFFVVVSDCPATLTSFVDATSAEFNELEWTIKAQVETTRIDDGTLRSRDSKDGASSNGKKSSPNATGNRSRHGSVVPRTTSGPKLQRASKANSATSSEGDDSHPKMSKKKSGVASSFAKSTHSHQSHTTVESGQGSSRLGGDKSYAGHLTVAMHFGRCVIDHDAISDTYEYRGAPLTTCALLLDVCAGGQFLATDAFQEALMDTINADCGSRLTLAGKQMQDASGEQLDCLQYNVNGFVKRFDTSVTEQVDSAAAAADHASGLLTRKRVTLAVVRVADLQRMGDRTGDDITAVNNDVFTNLEEYVRVHRGHLHAVLADLIFISFNAARPTSEQGRRALQVCNDMIDAFADDRSLHGRVTCGVAVGHAFVGRALDGSISVAGPVIQEALDLETACRALPAPIDLVVTDEQEFSKSAALQWVGVLPPKPGTRQFPRRGVLSVTEMHNDADEGEWLYLLQQREGRGKDMNDAFRCFAEGGDGARALEKATAMASGSGGDGEEAGAAEIEIARNELAKLARQRLGDGDSPAMVALIGGDK